MDSPPSVPSVLQPFVEATRRYVEAHFLMPPEFWILPGDGERSEYRRFLDTCNGNIEKFAQIGTGKELDLLSEALDYEFPGVKNIALMSILEVCWARNNRDESVSESLVFWFRQKKFRCPLFSFEKC
jgi:hypothetical protein